MLFGISQLVHEFALVAMIDAALSAFYLIIAGVLLWSRKSGIWAVWVMRLDSQPRVRLETE